MTNWGMFTLSIGKVSFTAEDLKTNLEEVIAVITRAKACLLQRESTLSQCMSPLQWDRQLA